MIIAWVAPDNGGSAITSYIVELRQVDDTTYTQQLSYCDGSSSAVVADKQCSVPISTLIDSPYSLLWGDLVYARVTAVNVYGESSVSNEGTGATISTVPDAPLSLANTPAQTTGEQITFSWAQGIDNGGTPVIDFNIQYKAVGGGSYSDLALAVAQQTYTAVGLTRGISYSFKVQARNAYGLSLFSDEVTILAA